jgi:cytochrome c-type biogenesis protein CcmH/NrfF
VLLVGAVGVVFYLRRRRPDAAPAPLDAAERQRLDALLREGEG